MGNQRLYISVNLAVAFLFPLLFQPFHIIFHHHDPETGHALCMSDQFCQGTEKKQNPIGPGKSYKHKKSECPVCKFEFTTYSISDPESTKYGLVFHEIKGYQPIREATITFSGHFISLRAPPVYRTS